MKTLGCILLIILVMSITCADPPASVQVKGTCVALVPPADFTEGKKFCGFLGNTNKAIIIVNTYPVPYATVIKDVNYIFTGANFTSEQSRDVMFGTVPGKLYTGASTKDNTIYSRWFGFFGDDTHSSIVVGSIISDAPQADKDALLTALTSASISFPQADMDKDMPFTLCEMPPILCVTSIKDNTVILQTKDAQRPYLTSEASLTIRIIPRPHVHPDLMATVKASVMKNPVIDSVTIIKSGTFTLDNLPAAVITATGKLKADGTPVYLYELYIAGESCYYTMQGVAPQSEVGARYVDVFKRVAGSFKRKSKM